MKMQPSFVRWGLPDLPHELKASILFSEIHMRYVIVFISVMIMVFSSAPATRGESVKEETFQRLDKIREHKKKQLFEYLQKITDNADAIRSDEFMLGFFHLKSKYYRLQKSGPPPAKLRRLIGEVKKNVRAHYLHNYLAFYDILFIDKDGNIFYTIRQQADYHKNIFQGELAKTTLARQLLKHPNETFVDYEYYAVSDEPSAFLVEPIFKEGHLAGWFVLQCAINKINNMFTEAKGIGTTGEVFLVNKEQYMLTESRFSKDSSPLNQHLSPKNIDAKFRERSGHKIVIDYRGFRALSSFEVCRFGNSEWLLIAKIDEDEIVTEQYKKKRKELRHPITESFQKQKPEQCNLFPVKRKVVEVDIDEFRKVHKKELLCTYGVSTCTAIIVSFPEKFAYMGHISNLDIVYGGKSTDLIGHIFKRIDTFDIYKYERRKLVVTVIANHLDSIMNTIDRLVAEGIFLSQIKFIYNPDAQYGNVIHDYLTDRTLIKWKMDRKTGREFRQCASDVETVGEMVKPLIGYN